MLSASIIGITFARGNAVWLGNKTIQNDVSMKTYVIIINEIWLLNYAVPFLLFYNTI